MSWKPTIVDPRARYLHENLGITEERRLELCRMLDREFHGHQGYLIVPVWRIIEVIAELAQTPEEYAYMLVVKTMQVQKSNNFL